MGFFNRKSNKKFREFGIIDKFKIFIRRKMMGTTKFLIVVDTTYSRVRTSFPPAIIDVQIVSATDEQHARQLFLRSIPRNLVGQLQDNLYVFNLNALLNDMDTFEKSGGVPVFKFVLPGNRRPPKSNNVANQVTTTLGNETITQENDSSTVDHRVPEEPPKAEPPAGREVIAQANKSVRSAEFQEREYVSRTTPNTLSEEQESIVKRLGADRSTQGAGEEVNSQVNATTGIDQSLRPREDQQLTSNEINEDQAAILSKIGALGSGPEIITNESELIDEIPVVEKPLDESLTEVPDEAPLTEEDIKRLEELD